MELNFKNWLFILGAIIAILLGTLFGIKLEIIRNEILIIQEDNECLLALEKKSHELIKDKQIKHVNIKNDEYRFNNILIFYEGIVTNKYIYTLAYTEITFDIGTYSILVEFGKYNFFTYYFN